jgi:hypothetical protein
MKIKPLLILLLFILALGFVAPSCYYDKEETLYPFTKCDTVNVTYSQTVVPILTANCYVCHSTGNQQSTIILDTYGGVREVALNGKLIPAIEQTGPFPMPKSGSKLDPCSIDKIKKWVNDGAPQN